LQSATWSNRRSALGDGLLDMLGFTPRERARLRLAEVKANSTLERLRVKRQGPR
jgi:hypothetical protein